MTSERTIVNPIERGKRRRFTHATWSPPVHIASQLGLMLTIVAVAAVAAIPTTGAKAVAGGSQIQVAASGNQLWATLDSAVIEINARTGKVVRRIKTHFAYPTAIGLSAESVWVASVTDGYTSGSLDHVSTRSSRRGQPLVFLDRPVLSLAVGRTDIWGLLGPPKSLRLAHVNAATGHISLTRPSDRIVRIVADNTGALSGIFALTSSGRLVHFRNGSRFGATQLTQLRASSGPLAAGLGNIWMGARGNLFRVNATSGKTTRAQVPGLPLELTVGRGYVWLLSSLRPNSGTDAWLVKISPRTLQVVARRRIPGVPGGMAFGANAIWIALDDTQHPGLLEINPQSLRARTVHLRP